MLLQGRDMAWVDDGDQVVVLHLPTGTYRSLPGTARLIWLLVLETGSVEETIATLRVGFRAPDGALEADVHAIASAASARPEPVPRARPPRAPGQSAPAAAATGSCRSGRPAGPLPPPLPSTPGAAVACSAGSADAVHGADAPTGAESDTTSSPATTAAVRATRVGSKP